MKEYILIARRDEEPASISRDLMKNKQDILEGVENFSRKILKQIEDNADHTIGYYKIVEKLLADFREKIQHDAIPTLTEDWWHYSLHLVKGEISLSMDKLHLLSYEDRGNGSNGMSMSYDAAYSLLKSSTKKLCVE